MAAFVSQPGRDIILTQDLISTLLFIWLMLVENDGPRVRELLVYTDETRAAALYVIGMQNFTGLEMVYASAIIVTTVR